MSDADEGGARRKSLGRLASAKGILSFICSSIRAFKTNIVVSFGLGSDHVSSHQPATWDHKRNHFEVDTLILRTAKYLEHDK